MFPDRSKSPPTRASNHVGSCLARKYYTMANTLAYYDMELITSVKKLTVQALDGLRMKIGQVEKTEDGHDGQ
jgi:hypothetical protein